MSFKKSTHAHEFGDEGKQVQVAVPNGPKGTLQLCMFVVYLHAAKTGTRAVFDIHRHGCGTNVPGRWLFLLFTYLLTVHQYVLTTHGGIYGTHTTLNLPDR